MLDSDISLIVTVLLGAYGGLIAVTWRQQNVNIELKEEVAELKMQMQPLWCIVQKAVPDILYDGKVFDKTEFSISKTVRNALARKREVKIRKEVFTTLEKLRRQMGLDSITDVVELLLKDYSEMPFPDED